MKCEKCEKNITGMQWHEMRDDEGYVIARYCSAECAMKDNGIIKARDALCAVCGKLYNKISTAGELTWTNL